ncbi:MAG: hypothetical protein J6Q14_03220 [Oscillospiraceae bacterium]|nr:hypothetical protein [Oscillospiraceae bacterium]
MFSMRNFVKDGFLKAVGKMADYQVILNAAGWHEKGVLTEEDLAQIQSVIQAKNTAAESVECEDTSVGCHEREEEQE